MNLNKLILTVLLILIAWQIGITQTVSKDSKDSVAIALLEKNKDYAAKKDYKNAIATGQELMLYAKSKKETDTTLWIQALYRIGFYQKKENKIFEALDTYSQALLLSKQSKNYELLGKLSVNTSDWLNTFGDYQEAQKTAILGIEAAKMISDSERIYKLYKALANAASNNFEFDVAEKAYQNAMQFTNDRAEIIDIKNSLAVNFKDQKKYTAALDIYEELLSNPYLTKDSLLFARIQSNYGNVLFKNNNKKNAIAYLNNAIEIREQLNDWSGLFASNVHLAQYYKDESNSMAITYAQKALYIATHKTKSPESQVEALKIILGLGNITSNQINNYIRIDDSIKFAREKVRNTYTAVKFQTKEKELEIAALEEQATIKNLELEAKERRMLVLYIIITAIALSILGLITFYRQRQKLTKERHKTKTLEAKEHERNKLSGNIHDTVAAKMREAMLYADHINQSHPNVDLSIIGDKIEAAYQKLRTLSSENKHLNFKHYPFPHQMQDLLDEKEKLYKYRIDMYGVGDINWKKIVATIKVELYRSIQEALLNTSKYGKATLVIIEFQKIDDTLITIIKDNGEGCNISKLKENVGLADMRRRMELLNGTFEIMSEIKHGFTLRLGVPLK